MANGARDVDVAVVGGGPAGTAASIVLARHGLSVALFERASFPRHRPGETLHPGVQRVLEDLGVWAAVRDVGFLRHRGHWVAWNSPMRFERFGEAAGEPWEGIQAWRPEFDRLLLDHAASEGVSVLQPVEVLRPRRARDRVVGMDTTRGQWAARWVIDASGAEGWLQRSLRLHVARRGPTAIVRYGYAHGDLGELLGGDGAPRLVGTAGRWTWMAQVRPDLIHWCRGTIDGLRVDSGPPPELAACRRAGPLRGAETTCRIVVECAGRGFFLAGDAAAVVDPISSHGVLRALLGGIHLGSLIGRMARGFTDEGEAGLAYVRGVQAGFAYDCAMVRRFYEWLGPGAPRAVTAVS